MLFHLPDGEEISFPSLSQTHYLHDHFGIAENNPKGVLDESKLLSALARPQHAYAYAETTPDLVELAAILWHGLSQAHGYQDGNKRTALLVALTFLEVNGITYDAPDIQIGRLVWTLFRRDLFKISVLDDYLRRYCRWR